MEQSEKFDAWGIAEILGHKRFAGHITEQTIAGAALVRVDVPAVTTRQGKACPEYSKLIGVGSIYCITPTTEEVARKAATVLAEHDADPLPVYIPPERQLPAPVSVPSREELVAEGEAWKDDLDDDDLPL